MRPEPERVEGVFNGHQNVGFEYDELKEEGEKRERSYTVSSVSSQPGGLQGNLKKREPRYSVTSIHIPPGVKLQPRGSCVLALRKTRKSTQFLAAAAANMGAFALGSVLSWTATALPSMEEHQEFHVTEEEQSWIAAIATIGAVAACPFASSGMTYFGRRKTMLLMTLPFIIGWMLIFFAEDVAMILAGRFLTGLAGGSFTITAPVFIAETADIKYRGGLASGFDLMVSAGMFFILTVGAFVPWRTQALACGVVPFILFALVFSVPESPRYLVEQERYSEAEESLSWLYGTTPEEGKRTLEDIMISVGKDCAKPVTFRKIFMKMSVLKPILVCLGLMLFTTLSGYDAVMFYTVEIFQDAGPNFDPRYSAIVLGGIQVLATIPAALIVDKFGRRLLLMISEIFMCISLLAMGAYFFVQNPRVCEFCHSLNLAWLPLTSLTSFIIAYSLGIGPLSLMMIGELLPQHIKGLASCMVLTFRWILGFAVTKLFDDFGSDLGMDGCYWFFSSCCALGVIFVFFGVPETKGKTLDEIQLFFVSAAKLKQEQAEEEEEEVEVTTKPEDFPFACSKGKP